MNKVEIDWTRCDGHGLCATLLPDDVVLDEWGFPVLRGREITAGELTDARRAVLACPALALRLNNEAVSDGSAPTARHSARHLAALEQRPR